MNKIIQSDRMVNVPFSGIRKVSRQIQDLEEKGKRIINLSGGSPNFDTPIHIKEAAKRALDEGKVRYTSNSGTESLRNALVEKLKEENGIVISNNELIITVGASEGIFLTMMALLNVGDEVLIPNPTWINYDSCIKISGAKSVSYSLKEENNFEIDIQEIEKLINNNTKMIVINTPHNPTGAIASKDILEKISRIAKKYNLIVLSDEIYEKLIYDNNKHYSIASFPDMKERTITINGFSKTYAMTGWRIGYVVGEKKFLDAILRARQYSTTCPTSFAQYGAEQALRDSQDCVEKMKNEYNKRRKLIINKIKEINGLTLLTPPQGAFYAFINIKKLEMNSEDASNFLLKESGVAVVPGSVFGSMGEGFVRMSFVNSYENIEKGLDNIKEIL